MSDKEFCPRCGSDDISEGDGHFECNSCSYKWIRNFAGEAEPDFEENNYPDSEDGFTEEEEEDNVWDFD